jgi:glycosyltransferase involved in cell wall biosynthesis
MEAKGLISVIIPVYNVEKYLRECVDSVLSQTYKSYEIILVDDGSTDGSGEICDEYIDGHSQVKVIHKANGGLSDARNTGLKNAKGEYVYFLDSDDYIVPDAFQKLINISIKEQSDFVFFDASSFLDENSSLIYASK